MIETIIFKLQRACDLKRQKFPQFILYFAILTFVLFDTKSQSAISRYNAMIVYNYYNSFFHDKSKSK